MWIFWVLNRWVQEGIIDILVCGDALLLGRKQLDLLAPVLHSLTILDLLFSLTVLDHRIILGIKSKIEFRVILILFLFQFLLQITVDFVILLFPLVFKTILGGSVLLVLAKNILSSFRNLEMIYVRHHIFKLWTKGFESFKFVFTYLLVRVLASIN